MWITAINARNGSVNYHKKERSILSVLIIHFLVNIVEDIDISIQQFSDIWYMTFVAMLHVYIRIFDNKIKFDIFKPWFTTFC